MSRRSKYLYGFLIVLLNLGIYSISLNSSLMNDDFNLLADGVRLPLYKHFIYSYQWFYRPLHMALLDLSYQVFGLEPVAHHLLSLVFHLVNLYLLYRLILMLGQSSGFAIGVVLIYSLFANHVDAVVWISARCDLMFTTGVLLAYLCIIRLDRSEALASRIMWLGFSVLFYSLSLLCKETALTFLTLGPLYFFLFKRPRVTRENFIRAFLVFIFYLAVTILYLHIHLFASHGSAVHYKPVWELRHVLKLLNWNVTGLLVPTTPLVNKLVVGLGEHSIWALVWVLALVVGVIHLYQKLSGDDKKLLELGVSWIVIIIGPFLFIVFTVRYLYVPMMGFAMILAMAIKSSLHTAKSRRLGFLSAGIIILYLTIQLSFSVKRSHDWHRVGEAAGNIAETVALTQKVRWINKHTNIIFINLPRNFEDTHIGLFAFGLPGMIELNGGPRRPRIKHIDNSRDFKKFRDFYRRHPGSNVIVFIYYNGELRDATDELLHQDVKLK
jgi:hypothetical protein